MKDNLPETPSQMSSGTSITNYYPVFMLHYFTKSIADISLPDKFTYPFHYTPHPLCLIAAELVQDYIVSREEWAAKLMRGKMFGVLIVKTPADKIGYLAAFSGNLAHQNMHSYFVPPVYDLLHPQGFFRIEEENITAINTRIKTIQADPDYLQSKKRLTDAKAEAKQELSEAKEKLKVAKHSREMRRKSNPDQAELSAMVRESQHQKAALKRLEHRWQRCIAEFQNETDRFEREIDKLRTERKHRSANLQQQLFEQFRMLNNNGQEKTLCEIFEHTAQRTPPAGAGECAAPKLLQYAYLNKLKPIAMAEFWWGDSPKTEIRHHRHYYPACKGKCEPILEHMLQGVDVEANPLLKETHRDTEPEIVFEDTWLLIVNKPEGMLSVPGKSITDSVSKRMQLRYPEATGPMIVHRLDMATSGLLLIAKTKDVHKNLQKQFKNREVKKRYIALLDGVVANDEGTIELPLCMNPLDRPRQMVSEEYGKPAVTRYQVLDRDNGKTRIAFYPLTGRTHQLRMHAAHPNGLNAPIIGDELYGRKAERLYLHAELLEFRHPVTNCIVCVEKKATF